MGGQVRHQHFSVGRAAFRIAQGVELQTGAVANAQRLENMVAKGDDLDIAHGRRRAQKLHADLMELAKPPLLRPFVTEHRPRIEELERQALA